MIVIILALIAVYLAVGVCVGFAYAKDYYRKEARSRSVYEKQVDYLEGVSALFILLGWTLFWPVLWAGERIIHWIAREASEDDRASSDR